MGVEKCRRIGQGRLVLAALLILITGLALVAGCPTLFLGGTFNGQPEQLSKHLSPAAQALLAKALGDLGSAPLVDYHAHIIGIGTGNSHAEVNPALLSWWHPAKESIRVFFSAPVESATSPAWTRSMWSDWFD